MVPVAFNIEVARDMTGKVLNSFTVQSDNLIGTPSFTILTTSQGKSYTINSIKRNCLFICLFIYSFTVYVLLLMSLQLFHYTYATHRHSNPSTIQDVCFMNL